MLDLTLDELQMSTTVLFWRKLQFEALAML